MLPRRTAVVFALMLASLLAPRIARAALTWLPDAPPFAPLIADPREPRFGFDLIEGARASAFAGGRYALANLDGGARSHRPSVRVSVDGMLWAWLSRRSGFNFPLETVDGSFGLAFDVGRIREGRSWSARMRYGHISSHLGDGGYDIEARRIVYSRESITLVGSYAPSAGLRAYAGPTLLLHGAPRAPGFQFQVGGEARRPRPPSRRAAPYAAFDLRLKRENANRVNQSYQAGVRLGGVPGRGVRLSVGYEVGDSERGQEWRTSERFLRAGIALGD